MKSFATIFHGFDGDTKISAQVLILGRFADPKVFFFRQPHREKGYRFTHHKRDIFWTKFGEYFRRRMFNQTKQLNEDGTNTV